MQHSDPVYRPLMLSVMEADEAFQKAHDAGTKTWLDDYFLPQLQDHGLMVVPIPVTPPSYRHWYWMTKDEHGPIAHAWNGEKIPHPDTWYLTKVAVCGWSLDSWGLRLYQHLDLPDTAQPCEACEAILARGEG